MHGVNAHHARVSMPEPSHAFFAGWGDLAAVAAAALDVCTFGRAVRLRSRGAARAACGEAAADRRGLVDTAAAVTPDSAPDAGCASGFTHSATGSGPDERTDRSAGDGAAVANVAADAIADGVVDGNAGTGATADVATAFVVVAIAASDVETISPEGGKEGRSRVQAPQPNATMPVNASETAALR